MEPLVKVRVYGHVPGRDDLVKASWKVNHDKGIIHRKDIIKVGRDMLIDLFHAPEFQYASIGTCNDKGIMKVKKCKWALMNNKGEELTEFKYDDIDANWIGSFFVGRIYGVGKSLLDSEGRVITKEDYKYICPTPKLEKYGIAAKVSKDKGDKSRLIDFEGNILGKGYDYIDDEADKYGLIRVSNDKGGDERFGAINAKGEEVIHLVHRRTREIKYDVEEFGRYKIVKCMDSIGLFDPNGKCLISIGEVKKVYHSLGFLEVMHGGKNYLFDSELNLKFSNYDSLDVGIMDESWKVQKNGETGLLDSNFKELIPIKYANMRCFASGYSVVQKNDGSFSLFDLRERKEIDVRDYFNKKSSPEELVNFLFNKIFIGNSATIGM